jgi:hypothetical protein
MLKKLISCHFFPPPTFRSNVGTRNNSGLPRVRLIKIKFVVDIPKYMCIIGWILWNVSLELAP